MHKQIEPQLKTWSDYKECGYYFMVYMEGFEDRFAFRGRLTHAEALKLDAYEVWRNRIMMAKETVVNDWIRAGKPTNT